MNKSAESYYIDGCGRCSKGGTDDCKVRKWKQELDLLRSIVLECGLEETCKWGHPTYMYRNQNVLLIHCFKEYAAIAFMKGSLLSDENNLLIQQTENVQATRQLRYTATNQIEEQKDLIKAFVCEAIELEKSGAKVELKKTEDFQVPQELTETFKIDPEYQIAFESLTPGRQRGYLLYFAQAKQSNTRSSRISKCRDKIFSGKGWNER